MGRKTLAAAGAAVLIPYAILLSDAIMQEIIMRNEQPQSMFIRNKRSQDKHLNNKRWQSIKTYSQRQRVILMTTFRVLVLLLYVAGMLYLTVFSRQVTGEHKISTSVLWSYARIRAADVRWQIYMNIYLFVPFGFLFALCIGEAGQHRNMECELGQQRGQYPQSRWNRQGQSTRLKWIFIAVVMAGAMLSIGIEAVQYYSCRGLCEFDDVFNNTIGAALGYVLWNVLPRPCVV